MVTRKEKLEAQGWKVWAEKNDQIFIATGRYDERRMLVFHNNQHDNLPAVVTAYYPSILYLDIYDQFFSDPKAFVDNFNEGWIGIGREIIPIWTIAEAEVIQ